MPAESGVFVCSEVFHGSKPVLLVARDEGDWMFLCGGLHTSADDYHLIGLNHLLERDPTLRALRDLSENSEAERDSAQAHWIRRPLTSEQR